MRGMRSAVLVSKMLLQDWRGSKPNFAVAGEQLAEVDRFSCLGRCILRVGYKLEEVFTPIQKRRSAFTEWGVNGVDVTTDCRSKVVFTQQPWCRYHYMAWKYGRREQEAGKEFFYWTQLFDKHVKWRMWLLSETQVKTLIRCNCWSIGVHVIQDHKPSYE